MRAAVNREREANVEPWCRVEVVITRWRPNFRDYDDFFGSGIQYLESVSGSGMFWMDEF